MRRARLLPLVLAAAGAASCALDALLHHAAGLVGYLAAFAFLASTALGALSLVMIAQLTSASWFVVLRRVAEACAAVTPLLLLAFVPIALGVHQLYPWASELSGLDESVQRALEHARPWLSPGPFLLRAALFLSLWLALAEGLRRASLREDAGDVERAGRRLKALSAAGLPLLGFSASFAAFDWFMSLVPGWNFNILGLYLLCGGFSSALGVLCVAVHLARNSGILPADVGRYHALALGRMLLMSVCLWAYLAASQLIIVWSANLPKEAGFYLARFRGPFRVFALTLLFAHFVVPLLLLLSRSVKQRFSWLAALGALTVLTHALDVYWLLGPAAARGANPLDLGPFLLLAALATALGLWRFRRAPSVPNQAPELARSLAYDSP